MKLRPRDATPPAAYLVHGQVMHLRLRPVRHRFVYPVFYIRVNLARLEQAGNAWFGIDRWRALALHSRDHGARDGSSLLAWIRLRLAEQGLPDDGEVWLQTFPRVLGFVFNPVSFWYCHDRQGQLRAVMAEVNNTFGQRHCYWLHAAQDQAIGADTPLSCSKAMHVSPFCEVRGHYRFRFRQDHDTSMAVIDYHDDPELPALLHTTVAGRQRPLTASAALGALCRQPWLTLGIVWRIHWQALLLWRKRVPWFGRAAPTTADSPHVTAAAPAPSVSRKEMSS